MPEAPQEGDEVEEIERATTEPAETMEPAQEEPDNQQVSITESVGRERVGLNKSYKNTVLWNNHISWYTLYVNMSQKLKLNKFGGLQT